MSQHITVDGVVYVVEDSGSGGEHTITVWNDAVNKLVCDIEINHNFESAEVTYRDGENQAVNYWEYVEGVEELGLRDADVEVATWAISVEM